MVDDRFLRPGFDFALWHAVEEAGEFLAAAGKTQRFGRDSYNPLLPHLQRELNEEWLERELNDLRGALNRLSDAMANGSERS